MDFVASAAVSILVPTGAANDLPGFEGSAGVLSEMLNKGAGEFDNRAISEEFEKLGIHHGTSAGIEVSMVSASLLGENLDAALGLLSRVVLQPRLPEEELDSVRELALQELKSLEDEPASKVMVELGKKFYPDPFGRSQLGTEAGLNAITIEHLRDSYKKRFLPSHAIIGIAGKFQWDRVVARIGELFGSWSGTSTLLSCGPLSKESSVHHIEKDASQVQIALAYPSVSFGHRDFYTAKVAIGVLSGGMAGRLFIEVREKRGLVYRVSASHSAAKNRAAVFCYAGTTPERAQETLDVMIGELRKVGDGVSEDELKRSKADLKSRIVMQGESSSVRASSIVNDWWNLGRVRTLQEIKDGVDAVTNEDICRHLREFPVQPVTLMTLGPRAIKLQ